MVVRRQTHIRTADLAAPVQSIEEHAKAWLKINLPENGAVPREAMVAYALGNALDIGEFERAVTKQLSKVAAHEGQRIAPDVAAQEATVKIDSSDGQASGVTFEPRTEGATPGGGAAQSQISVRAPSWHLTQDTALLLLLNKAQLPPDERRDWFSSPEGVSLVGAVLGSIPTRELDRALREAMKTILGHVEGAIDHAQLASQTLAQVQEALGRNASAAREKEQGLGWIQRLIRAIKKGAPGQIAERFKKAFSPSGLLEMLKSRGWIFPFVSSLVGGAALLHGKPFAGEIAAAGLALGGLIYVLIELIDNEHFGLSETLNGFLPPKAVPAVEGVLTSLVEGFTVGSLFFFTGEAMSMVIGGAVLSNPINLAVGVAAFLLAAVAGRALPAMREALRPENRADLSAIIERAGVTLLGAVDGFLVMNLAADIGTNPMPSLLLAAVNVAAAVWLFNRYSLAPEAEARAVIAETDPQDLVQFMRAIDEQLSGIEPLSEFLDVVRRACPPDLDKTFESMRAQLSPESRAEPGSSEVLDEEVDKAIEAVKPLLEGNPSQKSTEDLKALLRALEEEEAVLSALEPVVTALRSNIEARERPPELSELVQAIQSLRERLEGKASQEVQRRTEAGEDVSSDLQQDAEEEEAIARSLRTFSEDPKNGEIVDFLSKSGFSDAFDHGGMFAQDKHGAIVLTAATTAALMFLSSKLGPGIVGVGEMIEANPLWVLSIANLASSLPEFAVARKKFAEGRIAQGLEVLAASQGVNLFFACLALGGFLSGLRPN